MTVPTHAERTDAANAAIFAVAKLAATENPCLAINSDIVAALD
jgi:hypothetical protein